MASNIEGGETTTLSPDEAFSILGNDTRLEILRTLWEAYEPFEEGDAVPFAKLRDRVGIPRGGKFNYHLDKLVGHFIRKTAEGYKLSHVGLRLVQTVIAGTGLEDPSLEPTEIDKECNLCGAPKALTYEDQRLYVVCTECDGFWGHKDDIPDGAHNYQVIDPAGLTDRSPEEVHKVAYARSQLRNGPLRGVCNVCSGPMTVSFEICENHADEGVCPNCDVVMRALARFRCSVCKTSHQIGPTSLVTLHPAGIAFFWDHGVPLLYEGDLSDMPAYPPYGVSQRWDVEVLTVEPPRVRVTVELDDDELQVEIEEDLAFTVVSESD